MCIEACWVYRSVICISVLSSPYKLPHYATHTSPSPFASQSPPRTHFWPDCMHVVCFLKCFLHSAGCMKWMWMMLHMSTGRTWPLWLGTTDVTNVTLFCIADRFEQSAVFTGSPRFTTQFRSCDRAWKRAACNRAAVFARTPRYCAFFWHAQPNYSHLVRNYES